MLAYACICTHRAQRRESSGHSSIDIHRWTIPLSGRILERFVLPPGQLPFPRPGSAPRSAAAATKRRRPSAAKTRWVHQTPWSTAMSSHVGKPCGQAMWASHDTTPGRAIVALCHEETDKSSRCVQSCSAFIWTRWKRRFNSNNIVFRHVDWQHGCCRNLWGDGRWNLRTTATKSRALGGGNGSVGHHMNRSHNLQKLWHPKQRSIQPTDVPHL